MKKKLFSLLLGSFFLICSFCSAGDFSIDSSYKLLAPSDCVGNPVISSVGGDLICRSSSFCYNYVICFGGFSFHLPGDLGISSNLKFKAGDYNITCESYPCYVSFLDGTYFEFYPPVEPLLPGGQDALSGVVSNLTNSVNEFIPLIVYVGIGILCACIGFVSIKRLINWVRNKTLTPFK